MIFRKFYNAYVHQNETRPLLTKCITASTLMGLGDFFCQSIECNITDKSKIDLKRLQSFTTYGFVVYGPMLQLTYSKILPLIAPDSSKLAIVKKIFFTQTVFAVVSLVAFYTAIPLLQGQKLTEGLAEVKYKLWPTLLTNWKVWPAFHLLNFTFTPVNLQAAYVACFCLFFNTYLSFMKFVVKRPDELQSEVIGETSTSQLSVNDTFVINQEAQVALQNNKI